jgi:hypothetical protein
MNLMEVDCDGVNWTELMQDMVHWQKSVNVVMNCHVQY